MHVLGNFRKSYLSKYYVWDDELAVSKNIILPPPPLPNYISQK